MINRAFALPLGLENVATKRLAPRAYLLLFILAIFILGPGLNRIPPIDRDEPRYAQATKQMITSGNYLDIRFQDDPRYKKPVGIYWLQSLGVRLLGTPPYDDITPYRLPSFLGGVLAILIMAWGISRIDGAATGLLASAILLSSVLVNFEARIAKTDAVMLMLTCLTQLLLARAYLMSEHKLDIPTALLFWFGIAAAILIKGPVLPIVILGTIAALWCMDRKIGWIHRLRWRLGLPLVLILTLPWMLWIGLATRGAFYSESVTHDFLGKILTGQDRGFLPPGYYLILFPFFFGPSAFPALCGFAQAWCERSQPIWRFILAWVLPVWIINELIFTKLPHYVLPCYPALAWAAARFLLGGFSAQFVEGHKLWKILSLLCSCALLLFSLVFFVLPGFHAGFWIIGLASGLLFLLQIFWRWRKPWPSLICGFGGAALSIVSFFGLLLPSLSTIMVAPQAKAHFQELRPCHFSRLITSGTSEPSVIFMNGTGTVIANGAEYAASILARDPCAVGLIAADQEQDFLVNLAAEGLAAPRLASMRAYNYNGLGWQIFYFYAPYSTRLPDAFP